MKTMYFLFALFVPFVSVPALNGGAIEQTRSTVQDIPETRCTRLRYEPGTIPDDATAVGAHCSRLRQPPPDGIEFLPNTPPKVGLSSSTSYITSAAPPHVKLNAIVCDIDGDEVLYTYSVTAGRLIGDGANANWSLEGVRPGTYTATVEVHDGCGCISFSSASVTIDGGR